MNAAANAARARRSHYELLGLPETFGIDRDALESAYRAVQAVVHPDRFTSGTDAERRMAAQRAAQVNEAARVLRDPLARAAHLCELHGVQVQLESNTALPAAFLQQQMLWREALDDARATGDAAALKALAATVLKHKSEGLARLADLLDVRRDYTLASQEVRMMMFVERIAADLARPGSSTGTGS